MVARRSVRSGMWNGNGSNHIEHCVVAFICDARVQEATAHTPRTLSASIKTTNWFRFCFLWTFLVVVANFAFFKLFALLNLTVRLLFLFSFLTNENENGNLIVAKENVGIFVSYLRFYCFLSNGIVTFAFFSFKIEGIFVVLFVQQFVVHSWRWAGTAATLRLSRLILFVVLFKGF